MNHNTLQPPSPNETNKDLPPLTEEELKLNTAVHSKETGSQLGMSYMSDTDSKFYDSMADTVLEAKRHQQDQDWEERSRNIPVISATEVFGAQVAGIDRTEAKGENSRFKKIAKNMGSRISKRLGIKVNREKPAPVPEQGIVEPPTQSEATADISRNPWFEEQVPLSDERIKINAARHYIEHGDPAAIELLSDDEKRFYDAVARIEKKAEDQQAHEERMRRSYPGTYGKSIDNTHPFNPFDTGSKPQTPEKAQVTKHY